MPITRSTRSATRLTRLAFRIAPRSESSQIWLVEVAPETTSTSALPLRSADSRRIGSARVLSASVCGPSPLSSTVSIPVRRRPVTKARTWMAENGVVIAGPSADRGPPPEIRLTSARGVLTTGSGLRVTGGVVS